jgi:hypothetical protein
MRYLRALFVVAAVLLALVAGSCGDGPNDSDSKRTVAAKREEAPRGALPGPDGSVTRSWGDEGVRRQVIAIFAEMQDDFRAGDMAAVCEHVDPFLLSQFAAGSAGPDARCERRLAAYKRSLQGGSAQPKALRLLWTRAYTTVTGIWVEDPRGKRFRVPFKNLGDGKWLLELGSFPRPDSLDMELTRHG